MKIYYNIGKSEGYLVQTRSQTKSTGLKLPEVHGVSKGLDPNIQLEKNKLLSPTKGNEISQERPEIGQRRAGMRRRRSPPIIQTITQSSDLSKKIPEASKIESRITTQTDSMAHMQSITNSNDEVTHRRPMIKDIPFYPDPTYKPPPKPTRTPMPGSSQSSKSADNNPEIDIDFEENSPFQDGVISETYQHQTSHSSKNLEHWRV